MKNYDDIRDMVAICDAMLILGDQSPPDWFWKWTTWAGRIHQEKTYTDI